MPRGTQKTILREVKIYKDGLYPPFQAKISRKIVVCPCCGQRYRCYHETDCQCLKCYTVFWAFY